MVKMEEGVTPQVIIMVIIDLVIIIAISNLTTKIFWYMALHTNDANAMTI